MPSIDRIRSFGSFISDTPEALPSEEELRSIPEDFLASHENKSEAAGRNYVRPTINRQQPQEPELDTEPLETFSAEELDPLAHPEIFGDLGTKKPKTPEEPPANNAVPPPEGDTPNNAEEAPNFDFGDIDAEPADLSFGEEELGAAEEPALGAEEPEAAEEPAPGVEEPEAAEEPAPGVEEPEAAEEPAPGVEEPEAAEEPAPGVEEPEAAEEPAPGVEKSEAEEEPAAGEQDTPQVDGQNAEAEPLDSPVEVAEDVGIAEDADEFSLDVGGESLGEIAPAIDDAQDDGDSFSFDEDLLKSLEKGSSSEQNVFNPTDKEYSRFLAGLDQYPHDVSLAISQYLSSESTSPTPALKRLFNAVSHHHPVGEISALYRKASGEPLISTSDTLGGRSYTYSQLQLDRWRFNRVLLEQVLPKFLAGAFIFIVGLTLLTISAFFMYRPLHSHTLFRRGIEAIQRDAYAKADADFASGFLGWKLGPIPMKGVRSRDWTLRYAKAYEERYEATHAERYYKNYLNVYFPGKSSKGDEARLDYARFLIAQGRYSDAEDSLHVFLSILPKKGETTFQANLLLAKVYMIEGQTKPENFELARRIYAQLIIQYRDHLEPFFGQLSYFLATQNLSETMQLLSYLINNTDQSSLTASQAGLYAKAVEFTLNKGRIDQSRKFLEKLAANKDYQYNPAYELVWARYYSAVGDELRAQAALNAASGGFDQVKNFGQDPLNFGGQLYFYNASVIKKDKNLLKSSGQDFPVQLLRRSLDFYSLSRKRFFARNDSKVKEGYSSLADLLYYNLAEHGQIGVITPQIVIGYYNKGAGAPDAKMVYAYHKGVLYYQTGQSLKAMKNLYPIYYNYPDEPYLSYALGNASMALGDYSGAKTLYSSALESLSRRQGNRPINTSTLKNVTGMKGTAQLYIKLYNNRSVSSYRAYLLSHSANDYSGAVTDLVYARDYTSLMNEADATPAGAPSTAQQGFLEPLVNLSAIWADAKSFNGKYYADVPVDYSFDKNLSAEFKVSVPPSR